jgi:hypothetical protein
MGAAANSGRSIFFIRVPSSLVHGWRGRLAVPQKNSFV